MHFGLPKKIKSLFYLIIISCFYLSCETKDKNYIVFSDPTQGQNISQGDSIKIKLDIADPKKINSVSYLIDGKLISKKSNADSVFISTKNFPLGYRLLTAIVNQTNQTDTITVNFVIKSNTVPKQLTYSVVNTFPHDTSAYTQGLSYVNGKLLESTGEKGKSELRWVNLTSGKTLQKTKLEPQYFGEGSVQIGDKIIMLTWQENIGFIFDAQTFKQLGTFPYQNSREGWGLTFDGKNILRTDGTNRIWKMNLNTYKEEGYIEVYDDKGAVNNLNELEYINGKIYANVYLTNKIVIINSNSGNVEAEIDLSALVPKNHFKTAYEEQNNVLNGIAWDEKGKRLFVTGKKWPNLYEIKLLNYN